MKATLPILLISALVLPMVHAAEEADHAAHRPDATKAAPADEGQPAMRGKMESMQ